MDFVKKDIKPDFIIWTGDNSPHIVWSDTEDEVIESTVNITKMLKQQFDGHKVTMVPIHGNHDTWPINYQDFSYPETNKAINAYAKAWEGWLDQSSRDTYKRFGYYSQLLQLADRKPSNTKIIGLNTQACNIGNWGLLKTRYDPGD
jgi:Calcineurin-like phosphoesterase